MSANPQDGPAGAGGSTLAHRVAAGSSEAEAEFAARFAPGVRALVRRHCRPGDPAVDDLVQDVLETVLRSLRAGSVRDEGALPGYVRGTVVLTVQAHYRKRLRRREDAVHADAADQAAADDPSTHAQRESLAATLRAVLSELNVPRDREVLHRFYLLEQGRQEICTALAIDVHHFHRVLFRARERLRQLLVQAGVEDAE